MKPFDLQAALKGDKVLLRDGSTAGSKHTLRDDLAGLAMQGLLAGHFAHYGHENDWNCGDLAKFSYNIADAMLIARELEKSSE